MIFEQINLFLQSKYSIVLVIVLLVFIVIPCLTIRFLTVWTVIKLLNKHRRHSHMRVTIAGNSELLEDVGTIGSW